MKKLLTTLVFVLGIAGAVSCGSDSPSEQCSPFSTTNSERCTSAQACCTSTQCRYVTQPGNMEFRCDGTNCMSAAMTLVMYCQGE